MNVLFITDSLGYPRVEPSGASAADVWTYRVRDIFSKEDNQRFVFYFDMKTGRDSSSLTFDVEHHIKSYQPNVIVLQIGIVDCYPRALTKLEHQVLPRIPILNKLSKKFVKKYYSSIVKLRDIAYVKESDFYNNLEKLKAQFIDVEWLVLPIAPANEAYSNKNPLIKNRVESYNMILNKVFGKSMLTSIYDSANLDKLYLSDNHHLSSYGHELLSSQVSSKLSSI